MQVDRRDATIEVMVDLVFDHPALPLDRAGVKREKEWYFTDDLEIAFDPPRQVALLTCLFRDAGALRARFDAAQLERIRPCIRLSVGVH